MLLRDLTIKNYRSFEDYRLNNLARVNLLVGDNNSGKTSVLEAAWFLVNQGSLSSIWHSLIARGEITAVAGARGTVPGVKGRVAELFHSFGGFSQPARFEIGSAALGAMRSTLGSPSAILDEAEEDGNDWGKSYTAAIRRIDDYPPIEQPSLYTRYVSSDGCAYRIRSVTQEGEMTQADLNESPGARFFWKTPGLVSAPAEYTAPWLFDTERLKQDWTKLIHLRRRDHVLNIFSLIVEDIVTIDVLPSAASLPYSKVDVLITTDKDSFSLSRLGEGAQWLFNLAIALVASSNGFVFVDEIDTGLHYSRMALFWRVMIKTAQALDVQIFATTHSLDCIRGLAEATREDQELLSDVAIHSIDRRMNEAVRYAGDEIPLVVQNEIEVR